MPPSIQNTKTLSETKKGDQVILYSIKVGCDLICRMTSLGLTPGAKVEVLQNYGRGPIIINVRGTHVALGRGEARKLLVTEGEQV
jgi:ferrous iron transport protein A